MNVSELVNIFENFNEQKISFKKRTRNLFYTSNKISPRLTEQIYLHCSNICDNIKVNEIQIYLIEKNRYKGYFSKNFPYYNQTFTVFFRIMLTDEDISDILSFYFKYRLLLFDLIKNEESRKKEFVYGKLPDIYKDVTIKKLEIPKELPKLSKEEIMEFVQKISNIFSKFYDLYKEKKIRESGRYFLVKIIPFEFLILRNYYADEIFIEISFLQIKIFSGTQSDFKKLKPSNLFLRLLFGLNLQNLVIVNLQEIILKEVFKKI